MFLIRRGIFYQHCWGLLYQENDSFRFNQVYYCKQMMMIVSYSFFVNLYVLVEIHWTNNYWYRMNHFAVPNVNKIPFFFQVSSKDPFEECVKEMVSSGIPILILNEGNYSLMMFAFMIEFPNLSSDVVSHKNRWMCPHSWVILCWNSSNDCPSTKHIFSFVNFSVELVMHKFLCGEIPA